MKKLKYLKYIKKNTIFKSVLSLYSISIINLLLPVIFIPFITSKIGVSEFGYFVISAAIFQYGTIIVEFGTTSPLVRRLSSGFNNDLFIFIIRFRLLLALIVLSIIYIYIYIYSENYSISVYSFIVGALGVFGVALNPIAIFQAKDLLPVFTFFTFITRIIITLIIVILVFYTGKSNVCMLMIFQFLYLFVVSVLLNIWCVKKNILNFNLNLKINDSLILKESASFLISTLFSSAYTLATPIILNNYFSQYAAGIYGFVDRVCQPLKQALMPMINVIYPKICGCHDGNEKIKLSIYSSMILTAISCMFLVVTLLSIDNIAVFVFKNFVASKYIYPLLLNVVFVFLSQIFIFVYIIPFGLDRWLKYIYACMFLFFFASMHFSIKTDNLLLVFWSVAYVELLGFILLSILGANVFWRKFHAKK